MSNIQMMIKIFILGFLGFLLFHIQVADMQVLLDPWEVLVKEFFLVKC